MRQYKLKNSKIIPKNRLEDVKELQKFIRENLDIDISLRDTYEFWSMVSESWCAGWLYIDTHYDGETREESLIGWLRKYGIIEDDDEEDDYYEDEYPWY